MGKNKSIAIIFVLLLVIPAVHAALAFRTDIATKIIVSKILSASPQGQALLTAYQWATNPEASVIGLLPGGTSEAIQIVIGADPITLLGSMVMQEAQQKVLGKIYESLTPEGKIAFSNAQEYVSYARQVFKIDPESGEGKKFAECSSYDEKTGIMSFGIMKDGKCQNFLRIPKGYDIKTEKEIMTITSGDAVDQEFRFKDEVFAYMQKSGTVKVQGEKIIEANFVTAKESRIKFEDMGELVVPANTTITFKNGIAEIEGKTIKFEKENIEILGESIKISGPLTISGIKVKEKLEGSFKIKDIEVKDGILSLEKEGYILFIGAAEKNNIRIMIRDSHDAVLIANSDADVLGYKGNWMKLSTDKLEMHSAKGSKIKMAALAGNELFDMKIREYAKDEKDRLVKFQRDDEKHGFLKDEYGYKYKIVPNEKQLLGIEINDGDGLSVKSRKGMIPEINHDYQGGSVKIADGRFDFTLDKELKVVVNSQVSSEAALTKIKEGRYQSVPFELLSPALGENKLRIGATNQYAMIDRGNKERVVFNKFGIPIAAGDGQMQTLDQLRAKWKEKGIELKMYEPHPWTMELLGIEKMEKTELSPYMAQVVDYWLETHPEAVSNIKTIEFSDEANAAFTGQQSLLLGELIFDPYYSEKLVTISTDRNFDRPLTIITHEYEHLLDDINKKRDTLALRHLVDAHYVISYPEMLERASKVIGKEDKIEEGDIVYALHYATPELIESDKNRYEEAKEILENEGYEGYMRKFHLRNVHEVEEHLKGKKSIYETMSKDTEIRDFLEKEGFDKTMDKYSEYIRGRIYGHRIHLEVNKNMFEYFANKPETRPLDLLYNDIVISSKEILIKNDRFKDNLFKVMDTLEKEKDAYKDPLARKGAEKLIEQFKKEPEKTTENIVDHLGIIAKFGEVSEDMASLNKEMIKIVEEETGLPATYAFRDYGAEYDDWLVDQFGQGYKKEKGLAELSTTYREESIEERRSKVNSPNPKIRELYTELTQLAFDSDKMDAKEYQEIMGLCKKKNCCDQKCKIYKLDCKGEC